MVDDDAIYASPFRDGVLYDFLAYCDVSKIFGGYLNSIGASLLYLLELLGAPSHDDDVALLLDKKVCDGKADAYSRMCMLSIIAVGRGQKATHIPFEAPVTIITLDMLGRTIGHGER
jgi:hypothetical protein